jgi:uncharacterized membrane protein YcaP (DUF421 family)
LESILTVDLASLIAIVLRTAAVYMGLVVLLTLSNAVHNALHGSPTLLVSDGHLIESHLRAEEVSRTRCHVRARKPAA